MSRNVEAGISTFEERLRRVVDLRDPGGPFIVDPKKEKTAVAEATGEWCR